MTQAKFITFEGGEGGGKSTQSKLLMQAFNAANIDAINTREPGGTNGAEEIRQLLVTGDVDKWNPITETLLHLAARKDHIEKLISPSLEEGKYVICDRFSDSTMSYQGYGHGLGRDMVNNLQNMIIGQFKPDLTIILDIAIDQGIARADERGDSEDRYEKMGINFHEKVRNGFLQTADSEPERCYIIRADNTIANIHQQIISLINDKMGLTLALQC